MSGRKTTYTTVSVDELQRLRREAAEASTLSKSNAALRRLSDKTDQLLRDQQAKVNSLNGNLQSLTKKMEQREAASSKERQKLRQQLSDTITRTDRAMKDMAEQNARDIQNMQSSFMGALEQTRDDVACTIAQNNRRVEQAIHSAVSGLEEQIGSVNGRVAQVEQSLGTIRQSNETLLEMAHEYLETARMLMENSEENFRLELLLPGRAETAWKAVRQAESDIDVAEKLPTNSPIARQNARVAVEEAMRFREDIIRAEQEWQAHYQQARQTLHAAQAQREASSEIKLSDGEEDISVDVDFWTAGDLTALDGRIQSLDGKLDSSDGLTLADLDNIRGAGMQIIKEIQEATEFAAIAVHASADRYEIAEDVAAYLAETLNLSVESDGYQGGDQRGAHRLHLVNPATGFDMVVTQTPQLDETSVLGNRLETDILDYGTNNMEQGDKIALQALQALSGLGLRQDGVETVPGFEERPSDRGECADMLSWKLERAQAPRPVHKAKTHSGEAAV